MRLRTHLVVLVLAAVVPLFVFAVVIVSRHIEAQQDILERGMRDTVRALSLAADREVRTSLAILRTLAASPALDASDFKGFHELCVKAIAGRKSAWIILFDPSGQQLLNSSRPFGSPLPNPFRETRPPASDPRYPRLPLGGAEPVRRVFQTGQPVISDLFVALDSRQPTIGVGIPVVRNDAVRYVLEMSLEPELLTRLLLDQRTPTDSVATLLDSKGLIIARTLTPEAVLGLPLSPELSAQVATSTEGSGVGPTLEGVAVHHAFTRSKLTGWTISLGMSQALVSAPMYRSIAFFSGGAALALLLGLMAALAIGKRITAPISRLAGSAEALARGERGGVDVAAVREVKELHSALVTAGEAVREGRAERERRLVAEARRTEAQAANQAKDEFLAMLSHELRTPINAVYGWARMLQSGQVPAAAHARALDVIMRNAHAQVQLINDLLDISRIVTGKLRLEVRPVDVKTVVETALDAVRPAADGKGLRLHASLDPRAGSVTGDPDRLQQVTWNLLMNAVKFTPNGGQVQIFLQRVNSHVEIVVSDTGQGISPEMLPAIFDRFWQADSRPTRTHGGLGLGLALVRYLVEAHGGTVTAQSAGEGKGATFVVRLPVAPAGIREAGQSDGA